MSRDRRRAQAARRSPPPRRTRTRCPAAVHAGLTPSARCRTAVIAWSRCPPRITVTSTAAPMSTGTSARLTSERNSSVGSVNSEAAWSAAIIGLVGGLRTAAGVTDVFYALAAQMDVTFAIGKTHRSTMNSAARPHASPRGALYRVALLLVREVLPGVYHWTTVHPKIRIEVSSYWLENGGVLIDPLIPPDAGIDWFADRPVAPTAVILSNRHHYRHSREFADRYGCPVLCVRAGLHEFTDDQGVTAFEPGDTLPGGLLAFEIGGICPDDMALYLAPARAIWFADGLVRSGPDGALGFVPDSLMDDPPDTKRRLLRVVRPRAARARLRPRAPRPRRPGHRRRTRPTRGARPYRRPDGVHVLRIRCSSA